MFLQVVRSVILVCACALIAFGAWHFTYYEMFVTFHSYDDEGYSMISIKMFNEGNALYDQVFSTFGPAFYLYHWIVFGLAHVTVSHDAIRLLTIAHWLATALLFSLFMWRATKSGILVSLVFCQAVWHLVPLTFEPGHAQALSVTLVAMILVAATYVRPGRANTLAVALAAFLGGLLLLCKVNIGVFSFVPLLFTALLFRSQTRLNTIVVAVFGLAITLMPLVLMREHVGSSNKTLYYCLIVMLSVFSVVVISLRERRDRFVRSSGLVMVLAGAALAFVLTLAFVLARGTSLSGLLDGIVLRPMKMPSRQFQEADISLCGVLVGVVSAALASAYAVLHPKPRPLPAALSQCILFLKLTLAPAVFFFSLRNQESILLTWFTPFLWLLAAPSVEEVRSKTGPEPDPQAFPRSLLCVTAALHSMVAFPVPGSQLSWSTLLFLPAFAILFWDGVRACRLKYARRIDSLKSTAAGRLAPAALLLIVVAGYGVQADIPGHKREYTKRLPLGLPGARRIHLAPDRVASLNWASNNLRAHADCVLSLPGMYSFNFWSHTDPPTGFNISDWVLLLDGREQQCIMDAISKKDRVCLVASLQGIGFWIEQSRSGNVNDMNDLPLMKYLFQNFRIACEREPYTIFVRKSLDRSRFFESLLADEKRFNGIDDFLPLPDGIFNENPLFTLGAWFKTTKGGVILGLDNEMSDIVTASLPMIYIGKDGKVRVPTRPGEVITSDAPVNDGMWRHVVLTANQQERRLYIDGAPAGSLDGPFDLRALKSAKLGVGFTQGWPSAKKGWFPFAGTLRNVQLFDRALGPEDMSGLYAGQNSWDSASRR